MVTHSMWLSCSRTKPLLETSLFREGSHCTLWWSHSSEDTTVLRHDLTLQRIRLYFFMTSLSRGSDCTSWWRHSPENPTVLLDDVTLQRIRLYFLMTSLSGESDCTPWLRHSQEDPTVLLDYVTLQRIRLYFLMTGRHQERIGHSCFAGVGSQLVRCRFLHVSDCVSLVTMRENPQCLGLSQRPPTPRTHQFLLN
jgi:hypothetical protein